MRSGRGARSATTHRFPAPGRAAPSEARPRAVGWAVEILPCRARGGGNRAYAAQLRSEVPAGNRRAPERPRAAQGGPRDGLLLILENGGGYRLLSCWAISWYRRLSPGSRSRAAVDAGARTTTRRWPLVTKHNARTWPRSLPKSRVRDEIEAKVKEWIAQNSA